MATMAGDASPVYVTISALDAGHITLPEHLFVTDADPEKRLTVPSLSFLIRHPSPSPLRASSNETNIIFDLGVKRDLGGYTSAQQAHIAERQPVVTDPDCAASLRRGSGQAHGQGSRQTETGEDLLLDPSRDVDYVILSHVHWDHIGTPSDFSGATFMAGSGTLDLLRNGGGPLYPAELFNDDELPASRTVEFPPVPHSSDSGQVPGHGNGEMPELASPSPRHTPTPVDTQARLPPSASTWTWRPLLEDGSLPYALDLFGDGSLRVVDSPGHLHGHVNLLARVGERRYVYLGGDCCHDPRILQGEKGIAMYADGRGGLRSVHADTDAARQTLNNFSRFLKEEVVGRNIEVEVVLAHDAGWRESNRHRFWPGKL